MTAPTQAECLEALDAEICPAKNCENYVALRLCRSIIAERGDEAKQKAAFEAWFKREYRSDLAYAQQYAWLAATRGPWEKQ